MGAGCLLFGVLFAASLLSNSINRHQTQQVNLRDFPYPYHAMLAIESDADHVDLRKFNLIHEFLNTKYHTPLGLGLGLDIADSFFLYNGSNLPDVIDYQGQKLSTEMTFFKKTSHQLQYGPILLRYIKAGWIDTFHTIGDFSRSNIHQTLFSRSLAAYALHYVEKHGVHISVFTDHGNQSNVDNFGAFGVNHFEDYQQGDNPNSPYYISDLLHQEGVRFLWPDLYNSQYRYTSMLFPIQLRDGRKIWGFWRFTGTRSVDHHSKWGYEWKDLWNPNELAKQLSLARLQNLIKYHGYTILATHLEGNADKMPLSTSAIEALTHLAHLQDQGKILVARTSRLLLYNLVHQYLRYHVRKVGNQTRIDIVYVADPVDGDFVPTLAQLHGITFQVANPNHTILSIRGQQVNKVDIARSQHTIGFTWYPANTTNVVVWHNPSQPKKLALIQSFMQRVKLLWEQNPGIVLGIGGAFFFLVFVFLIIQSVISRSKKKK